MSLNLLAIWRNAKLEMQIIYDGRKVQVWEFVFQGLNIKKWSTGRHCDVVAVDIKTCKRDMSKRWHPSFKTRHRYCCFVKRLW